MPSKRRNDSDGEERPDNKTSRRTQLALTKFLSFFRKHGQQVGTVTPGHPLEDQVVFARVTKDDQFEFLTEDRTYIYHKNIVWSKNLAKVPLEERLNFVYANAKAFLRAAPVTPFCEFEYSEMRKHPQVLNAGIEMLRHDFLAPSSPGVLPVERNLIRATFSDDLERAKKVLERLTAAFPEARETLNSQSIARAAGYYAKFINYFPKGLQGPTDDARYDIYLLKASKAFWEVMIPSDENDHEQGGEGEPSSRPLKRRKLQHSIYELKLSNNFDLDEFASYYNMHQIPTFLTPERLALHTPLVKNADHMEELKTLSLVSSTIPHDIHPWKDDFDECEGWEDHWIPLPDDLTLKKWRDIQIRTFCQPPLKTQHYQAVLAKFSRPGETLPYVDGGFPRVRKPEDVEPIFLTNTALYVSYTRRCEEYAPNALSMIFLSKMNASLEDRKDFTHWRKALDYCFDNNLLVVTDEERESLGDWKLQILARQGNLHF